MDGPVFIVLLSAENEKSPVEGFGELQIIAFMRGWGKAGRPWQGKY
ncbi:MAG: hypothetical protein ACXWF8_07025 [Methylobacter sp.]